MLHIADDVPIWRENYKVVTKEQLNIPGLYMMGYAHFITVDQPLEDHFHTNMEFVVILNGKQKYLAGDKRYMLYGKDMFVSYPYEQHGNRGAVQDVCEFIWFQLDVSSPKNFLGLVPPYSEYVFQQVLKYRQRIRRVNGKELALLRSAFDHLSSGDFSKQMLGYSDLLRFIIRNICTPEAESEEDADDEAIQDVTSYIHKNLLNDLNIELLAEKCGLSASRFKAKFKEEMGVTPHAYINALKIDSAKVYLKDSERSITDIAYLLNFSSSNHFASVFKKYTGQTPTEFRNQSGSHIY